MQPQSRNLTRPAHFGLVRCDDGQPALHMHFSDGQLDAPCIGMFYQDLGAYHLKPGCVPMQAQIDPDKQVITVRPFRPTSNYQPFEEVSRHFGNKDPLEFLNADNCHPIEDPSRWKH